MKQGNRIILLLSNQYSVVLKNIEAAGEQAKKAYFNH